MRFQPMAPFLIVDDSSTMRTLVVGMLRQLGFNNVHEANDGAAAILKIKEQNFALIISDWHMEPMDGPKLLQVVREISTPGSNRLIFMTTDRTWGTRTSARIEGAEAFLTKPFTAQVLKATIESVLAR